MKTPPAPQKIFVGDVTRTASGAEKGFDIKPGLHSPERIEKGAPLSLETSGNLWRNIAVRFGGFTKNFGALVKPLSEPISDPVARIFFREKLASIVNLSKLNPLTSHRIIEKETSPVKPIWGLLLRTACGDSSATLQSLDLIDHGKSRVNLGVFANCVERVADYVPREASRILRHIFSVASTETRLCIFEMFVRNDLIGDNRIIGDLFVQLMARSTPDERASEIYPALQEVQKNPSKTLSPRQGFVSALYRGWMSEKPHG